ncbi:iron complex outermembrane receptor protein [Chitinophaga niastensis]|uniref:Iron complex outermembrane receptor protein n=1 Tax=Chitinophaga niastensis TaxID=536980 RepID=A0A2P8HUR7_CHINA|nr:TonB-dependent receptor [Chitinophaga niastensis]PSL49904.1 iron complex outermembrane receptor protein [Chitinophaga niastensis]
MIKQLIPTLFFLLMCTIAGAQSQRITGRITDINNQPVAAASIFVQASGNGTKSDNDGSFELQLADKDKQFTVTAIGFESYTQIRHAGNNYNITLQPALRNLNEVVMVGTRSSGRTRLNTVAPVDVFNIAKLQTLAPQNDLNQLLQYVSPSFNSNRQSSSDGSEHIDPASIRGLGPDQLLVLINGKRRHTTSLVNNQGTVGNGSVGTDLNAIPSSAIERIEVLRDGASAQYGSDAIAGVVNIVLKQNTHQLFASTTGGITSRGDGGLGQLNLNYGTGIGKQGGYINLTGEAYYRDKTTRAQNNNLIIFDQSALNNFFAYDFANDPAASRKYDDDMLKQKGLKRDDFNFQIGDAKIKNVATFFNLSLPFNSGRSEFYSFGGYSYRQGEGFGFRRLPSDPTVNVYSIYPDGYQPNTDSRIHDRSIAVGLKHKLGNWQADLSNALGDNRFDYQVDHTVNASLKAASPTSFKAGGHEFLQNTTNLDFSRRFAGVAAGLNLAFGGEFRVDDYRIRSGEEASWKNYALVINNDGTVSNPSGLAGGSQSFTGFSPENAIHKSRNNTGIYIDGELDVTQKWLISAASRLEHYSDFGTALSGKFATRYKLSPVFNVRGAVSNGFRAPSLHQQYFSYVSTDILPDNTLGQSGFFTNQSKIAKALGIPKLKQETSLNYSLGFTAQAARNFNISVDGYLTDIKNRIVLTGSFGFDPNGNPVDAIQKIINPLGARSARFFSNAVDTRTVGVDVVADYNIKSGDNSFNASLGFNYNKNKITGNLHIPDQLKGQEQIYFSPNDSVLITEGTPRVKINLSLTYGYKKFSVLLRNVYFGEVARNSFPFGEVQVHKGKVVTDLSFSYAVKPVVFTIGANNLLDVFPDKQIYGNSYFDVFKYASVQMGTLGSFYFARVTFNIPTGKK